MPEKSAQHLHRPDHGHFLRYAGGSILCALVNNFVLVGGDLIGFSQLVCVLIAWTAGGTIGYLYHHRLTFRTAPSLAGYRAMMTGTLLGLPLTYAIIALLHGVLGWPMWLAAAVMTVIMVAYNYLNARFAILWRRAPGS